MKFIAKIVYVFKYFDYFFESSMLDVLLGSEFFSVLLQNSRLNGYRVGRVRESQALKYLVHHSQGKSWKVRDNVRKS